MLVDLVFLVYGYGVTLPQTFARSTEFLDIWLWNKLEFNTEHDPSPKSHHFSSAFSWIIMLCGKGWNLLVNFLLSRSFSFLWCWAWFSYVIATIVQLLLAASWVLKPDETNETAWGFGQLLSLLMLNLPLISMVQTWEGRSHSLSST